MCNHLAAMPDGDEGATMAPNSIREAGMGVLVRVDELIIRLRIGHFHGGGQVAHGRQVGSKNINVIYYD